MATESTIFYVFMSIITGLLLFIIGWLINLSKQIGGFDAFMVSTCERIAKIEVRLDLIDKINGFLDSVDRRLGKIEIITSDNRMRKPRVKKNG
jgi:hypothetical protein